MSDTQHQSNTAQDDPQSAFDAAPKSLISHLLDAVLEQVDQPKKDIEANLQSAIKSVVSRYGLVTQEELEVQNKSLQLAQSQIRQLQAQLDSIK